MPSSAQGTDRSAIAGRVTDPAGAPVSGAVVRASSPALIGGARQLTTDSRGDYRFDALAPGTYRLDVLVRGFKISVRNDVHLSPDAVLIADFTLELSPFSETVEVTASSPVVDVTSAAAPYHLTSELLSTLPTDRVLGQVMNLVPAVSVDIGLGGVQQSNPLLVDGVNLADAMALLRWSSFNYNWVEDVQIVGVGAGAEYGEFSGIIQKSRLRSGGNLFTGLGEYRTTQPTWVGTNTSRLPVSQQSFFASQSDRIRLWRDSSAQVGGPLRRDRLWFFTGVQDARHDTQPALYNGPDSIEGGDSRIIAKIDAARGGSLRASGFYAYDRSRTTGSGLGPLTPIESTTQETLANNTWHGLVALVIRSGTTVDVDHSVTSGTLSDDPVAPATRDGPYPHVDLVTGRSSGNAGFYDDLGSARRSIGVTVRHTMDGAWGRRHHIAVGLQHERTRTTVVVGTPGGRFYQDLDGAPYLVDLDQEDRREYGVHRTTSYVQDSWAISDRVTLEPGLRVSFNRGSVTRGTELSTSPVSPRVGVAWDVTSGHTTVVRAHYGRYHDAALTAQASVGDEHQTPPTVTAQVVGPDQFVEVRRSSSSLPYVLDPEIRQGYFDQWTAGIERELGRLTAVTIQYVRRRYGDQMAFVDFGSVYAPITVTDPGADNRLGTSDDGSTLTVFRKTNPGNERYFFTNPPGVHRRYDALQVIGRRLYGAGWQMQTSYTWSSTRGNALNGLRSNSLGPDLGFNGVTADPNRAINAEGPAPWDFTHEVKLVGAWHASMWGGFTLSSVYQFHTGSAWGRTVQFPSLFVTFGTRIEPRGSRRTDPLNTIDLRVEKTVPLGRGGQAGIFADVLNATNQGIPDPYARRPVYEISGPSFGQPQFWLSPRTVRAAIRVSF